MADYIADYATVNTSADQLVGREAKAYAAAIKDSIPAGATLKFGQAFQRKAGAGIALALADLALINATQSLRVEFSYEDNDNFRRNLVTVKVECFEELNILRPNAIIHGEFGGS